MKRIKTLALLLGMLAMPTTAQAHGTAFPNGKDGYAGTKNWYRDNSTCCEHLINRTRVRWYADVLHRVKVQPSNPMRKAQSVRNGYYYHYHRGQYKNAICVSPRSSLYNSSCTTCIRAARHIQNCWHAGKTKKEINECVEDAKSWYTAEEFQVYKKSDRTEVWLLEDRGCN